MRLVIAVAPGLSGKDVVAALARLAKTRQLPATIRVDNGSDRLSLEAGVDSELEKSEDDQQRFMENRLRVWVDRPNDLSSLVKLTNRDAEDLILVTGPSGVGKSTLFARFVEHQQASSDGPAVFFHFVGANSESKQPRSMLRRLANARAAQRTILFGDVASA